MTQSSKFSPVFIINQAASGVLNRFNNPNAYIPSLVERVVVTTADGTMASTSEAIAINDNGWSTASFIYAADSTKYVPISLALTEATYGSYITSGYDTTSNTIKDLSAVATVTGYPILDRSTRHPATITAISNVGDDYTFTLTINAKERDLYGSRLKISNPDQSLTVKNGFMLFNITGYGNASNIVNCKAVYRNQDLSVVTSANAAKLVAHFSGIEDLPQTGLIYKTTAVASSNLVYRIFV